MKRRLVRFGCLLLSVAAAVPAGCDRKTEPITLQNLLKKALPPPPKQHVAMMFDVDDPDRRREGIEGLSKHSWGQKEPYLKAYATALKTDRDPMVRSAAVRALGRGGDAKYLEVIVAALKDEEVAVRWDAAIALDNVTGEAAIDPLRKAAVADPSVDVRVAAIQALRHYKSAAGGRVSTTLVRCLSDRDFNVRHRAHQVLVTLVGKDHGYDPDGWIAGGVEPPAPDDADKPSETKKPWWKRIFRRGGSGQSSEARPPGDQAKGPSGQPLKPTRRAKPWWKSLGKKPTSPGPKVPEKPAPPWRDWLDLTPRGQEARREAPAKPPAEKPAGPRRPWWDWLGMTSRKAKPAKPAAGNPAGPRRPWWDWLGMTSRKAKPAKPAAGKPAGSRRPWWDWFGVTKKKARPPDR